MNTNAFDLPKILFAIFAVIWALLAVDPLYRFDWFLENIAIFIFAPLVIWSYYFFRLSNRAYVLVFVFAMLHAAAAHYTYGATPWGNWISDLFGWERNHFDRIVHFLYGALIAGVFLEFIRRWTPLGKFSAALFAFAATVAVGAVYEIAEFVVGVTVSPEKGLGFLGFQGDVWDTQKDMALQTLGALLWLSGAERFFHSSEKPER